LFKIAIFASGRGSNFEALHRVLSEQRIDAAIVVVISNNSDAGVLALARSLQIPAVHLSRKQFATDREFIEALLDKLAMYQVDLIVLAGYMKKLDSALIGRYRNRIVNIHPALLPKYGGAGMYGHHVHEAVIAAGEKESGATVHVVTDEYDEGPIVLQERVTVAPGETPSSLAEKVLAVEHVLLPRAVALFARHEIEVEQNRVVITQGTTNLTDPH
jgi:phosphoribosylglycinamide formyltransferase 1